MVERQPSKLNVAGSNPVSRSLHFCRRSSGVERFLGKEEVGGSNPLVGSVNNQGVTKDIGLFFLLYGDYTEVFIFFKFSFRQAVLRKTLFFNSSEYYYTFVTQNEYYA